MHRKNTHFLTAKCRLVEWFIKETARDTWWHPTVLQVVFAQHSNFRDFWVAPRVLCVPSAGDLHDKAEHSHMYAVDQGLPRFIDCE